ncbi:sugar-binding domain-containing protein [Saccharopolyspora gloriosae]|uniref:sugar-binding domain-containing protein n=1 Tax=Saccharopolyspora gloriosae TaxID=455344 RepID=UPI001FB7C1FB|nr:sugar-binding domain-containing protein [Saccharopolyspora gloriosae]
MANPWLSRRRMVLSAAAVPLALSMAPRAAPAAAANVEAAARERIELDDGWDFRFGDDESGWEPVRLPHTWNDQDGQDGGDDYHRGPGWYRRTLRLPAESSSSRVFLQFDGANTVTDAWLDDVHLGQHRDGYTRFRFDITGTVRPGADNDLVVRVSNVHNADVAPLSADFTFAGGLYRSVSLQLTTRCTWTCSTTADPAPTCANAR